MKLANMSFVMGCMFLTVVLIVRLMNVVLEIGVSMMCCGLNLLSRLVVELKMLLYVLMFLFR